MNIYFFAYLPYTVYNNIEICFIMVFFLILNAAADCTRNLDALTLL